MPYPTTSQADKLMQKWLWKCNAHRIEAIPTGQTQGGTVRPLTSRDKQTEGCSPQRTAL